MKPTPKSPPEPGPLLAFGAHPDDIEFGCGGIIAREAREGRRIRFVVCSRGEAGSNGTPASRTAEARKGAAILGASVEFAELGGDAHIEVTPRNAIRLARIIRRVRPSIVLAPTTVENQHPDHSRLGRIVRDAARLARFGGLKELRALPSHAIGLLLHYALSPEAEPPAAVPILVEFSDPGIVAAWAAAMQAHASQARTRRYAEFQLARARVFGMRAGADFAQPLYPADPVVLGSLSPIGRSARDF
jgi:LmbE family N-acetylglucosaminyl deacetylase